MATTPKLGLVAPDYANAPDIPGDTQRLAASVESAVTRPLGTAHCPTGYTFPDGNFWGPPLTAGVVVENGMLPAAYGWQIPVGGAGLFCVNFGLTFDYASNATLGATRVMVRQNSGGRADQGGLVMDVRGQTSFGKPATEGLSRLVQLGDLDTVQIFVQGPVGQGLVAGLYFDLSPAGIG